MIEILLLALLMGFLLSNVGIGWKIIHRLRKMAEEQQKRARNA